VPEEMIERVIATQREGTATLKKQKTKTVVNKG
jgi:hypothetical protein